MEEALLRAPPVDAVPPSPDRDFYNRHLDPGSPAALRNDLVGIQEHVNKGRSAHRTSSAKDRVRQLSADGDRSPVPRFSSLPAGLSARPKVTWGQRRRWCATTGL